MMSSRSFPVIAWLLLVGWTFTAAQPVTACLITLTPPGFIPPSLADHINSVQIIVEGTIAAITEYEIYSFTADEATIQVQQYLKGSGAETIGIRGFGAYCEPQARVGDHRIFYAVNDTQGTLMIYATYPVNADNIAQIQEIVAQSPADQISATPTAETASDAATSDNTVWWYAIALLAVILIVIAAIYVRSMRRR